MIIFNLIKDNLKLVLNEPIIKFNLNSEIKLNELRYEQLCKLFQYLLSIKFIQQQNQYFIQKSSQRYVFLYLTDCSGVFFVLKKKVFVVISNTKQINNNDDSSFILNEANSKQKFEAFIYFFLKYVQIISHFFQHYSLFLHWFFLKHKTISKYF